ncbi:MAG: hypothetical protein ACOYA9_06145 [Bilifractor sp.]|jgi:hypothetical protein
MKKKDHREKDARISGIFFILYAIVLFIIAFLTLYSYFYSMQSSDDYISGWVNLFNIIYLLLMITFSFMALEILGFAILYLVMGIFILQKQPVFGIAIISFILSAGDLFLWTIYSSPDYAMYAINPVSTAGSVFFGILALMLSFSNQPARRGFIQKYWALPWILLVTSVFFSPLQYIFLKLTGNDPNPISMYHYLLSVGRLILLFPAYFFGCRWMKQQPITPSSPD